MSDRDASHTALTTAYLRAAHQLLDAPPRILEDPVALPLLGPAAARTIEDSAADYQTPQRCALRAHVVLRARFAEDCLAAAVGRGVSQYVILGAGLDTFALRQPAWARRLKILEVDHRGTQDAKRTRLADAGFTMPANVQFADIDLAREPLGEGLARGGLAPDEPTFFSWLGVTMYLDEDTVDAVLRAVAAFPPGSEIVFTFARPRAETPSPFAQHAASVGEPWLSYFEPDALTAKLRAAGFRAVEFLSPTEAAARYFRARPADLPAPQRVNIAHALK